MGAEISTIPTDIETEQLEVTRFEFLEKETELELPAEKTPLTKNGLKRSKSMSSLFRKSWKKTERAVSSFGDTLKSMCAVSTWRDPTSNYY